MEKRLLQMFQKPKDANKTFQYFSSLFFLKEKKKGGGVRNKWTKQKK